MKLDYAYKSEVENILSYSVRIVIPADGLQERIDKSGADDAAMLIGRLVLKSIGRIEGKRGIGNG
jgi:hypothetical protein